MQYHRRSFWRQRFAQVTAGQNWWAIRYHISSDSGNAQKYRFRCQQRFATACTAVMRWSGICWIWWRCHGRNSWAMWYHRRSPWRQRFGSVTADSDGGDAQKYRFRSQQRFATGCTAIIRWSWVRRRCHGRISWAMRYHRRSPWRRRFASVTADIGRCWWGLSELFSLRGHRGWVGRVAWMGRMGRVLILDQVQLLFATFFGSLQMTFPFFFRPISSNLEQKADI